MSVIVLGAGPAGLMAAHAATLCGQKVKIYSKKRKSFMRGAQYLHLPIPETPSKPFEIGYWLTGSAEGYRDKVYGPGSGVTVSPEYLVGTSTAWDIRSVYDHLWDTYSRHIMDFDIGPLGADQIMERHMEDTIVSTIPRVALCTNPVHSFSMTSVFVTEEPPAGFGFSKNNRVVCSGEAEDPWYRTSRIQGWVNTEYPTRDTAEQSTKTGTKIHQVSKPISTDCTCLSGIQFAGRYGAWTKGVLAHSAFYDTIHTLEHGRAKEQNQ